MQILVYSLVDDIVYIEEPKVGNAILKNEVL